MSYADSVYLVRFSPMSALVPGRGVQLLPIT